MNFAGFEEAGGCGFSGQVTLRSGEEFVANHELSNGGRAQQRAEIMRVKMPFFVWLSVGWLLMESHRIRESGFEEIVVADGNAAESIAERIALLPA